MSPGAAFPAKAKAAVCVPAPDKPPLAVFKLPVDVQLVPSYLNEFAVSVKTGFMYPPKPKPADSIPTPAAPTLAVGTPVTDVQLDPLYSSTAAVLLVDVGEAVEPAAFTEAVCIPKPAPSNLAVFKFGELVQEVPLYD